MTPEERFTKIENAIQALTETQARHEGLIEKQNAGIRDLVQVSRFCVDSIQELRAAQERTNEAQQNTDKRLNTLIGTIQELGEAQKHTDEKLNALIDTVDRIIRSRNGSGDQS